MTECINIGTRGSALAMRQAEIVIQKIQENNQIECRMKIITTKGDRILDQTLDKIGGKGLFVKEIEQALLTGEIDIAVHSMKDMPAEMPEELEIGAVLEREDPRDSFISKKGISFWDLPLGAKVGTGSLRRKMQLLRLRPDLNVIPIRGNINTRIRKIEEGLDGVVLAVAGLKRCAMEKKISTYFQPDEMLPAACQGILALQIRKSDKRIQELCFKLNHKESEQCARTERAFLNRIGADCHAPVGAYALLQGENIWIRGLYAKENIRIMEAYGSLEYPEKLGIYLGNQILKQEK